MMCHMCRALFQPLPFISRLLNCRVPDHLAMPVKVVSRLAYLFLFLFP